MALESSGWINKIAEKNTRHSRSLVFCTEGNPGSRIRHPSQVVDSNHDRSSKMPPRNSRSADFWNSERTYHFLQSLRGFRPFGIEKHFHMMFILEKFRQRTGQNIKADVLWDQIEEYYGINQLTEREMERLGLPSEPDGFILDRNITL